jgi:F0F1-type ATP synthase assembly protein I
MGNTNLDFNANNELHYMEAASKIIAGMISGFLIGLSIKSGILLPIFNNINSTHLAMILGGLIAGLSERLVPSIIQKIDGSKK